MKLLIADDNENIRKTLRLICSEYFYDILECSDGDAAIEIYKMERPDWVVMDIKMQMMDGIEATEKIITSNPKARVIIVSQFNDETTIDAAKVAGAVEFVSKENLSRVIDLIKGEI